jgi:Na+/H+ antiporter NhaD/arsenite permease-like protein
MIGLGASSTEEAARAIDLPTILLLFSFMVISAQMRLGGFYVAVTRRVAAPALGRAGLLAALIVTAAGLSAVFSNDIICLAMTPVVAQCACGAGLTRYPSWWHWPVRPISARPPR